MASRAYLRPVELARRTGVSTDTLRHYERLGLLPGVTRSDNGYREYPASSVRRVLVVRRAVRLGFTLEELARVLSVRDSGGAPCERVRETATRKLAAIDEEIRALERLKAELEATLSDWKRRSKHRKNGERVFLLESLVEDEKGVSS